MLLAFEISNALMNSGLSNVMQGVGIFSCCACCSTKSSVEYMPDLSEGFKLVIGRKVTVAFPEWSPFNYFCIKPDHLGCCFLNSYPICQRRSTVLTVQL